MKKHPWLILALAFGGCELLSEPLVCDSHQSPVFVSAWEEKLEEGGITYSKKNETTLCFESEQTAEAQKARLEAEPVYRGAATIITTPQEKKQLHEWLKKVNREYTEQQLDSERIFVVIFSGNQSQLEEAQIFLNCIQYQSECAQ